MVAVFSAQHLVTGNIKRFSRQVPKCHLNATYPTRCASLSAKLFDGLEQVFHIAGILSQQPAFQE